MSRNSTHWENVYQTKGPQDVSWTQDVPETSLQLIRSFALPKDAAIIDIGGGDSKLVDYLLEEGYSNLSVLDISASALNKAKERLGEKASTVKWIVSDITAFVPEQKYAVWHDRAAFHFLTEEGHIHKYVQLAKECVTGFLAIGTFSDNGPKKCSGLDIKQYNEEGLKNTFADGFTQLACTRTVHTTPFDTTQDFVFCSFKVNQ
ncbi:MAG: class I SAM-dependent methyltransferase [Filimonas sp.]|nr:class I SAM-dependent methyltransferase [Filimonas sp.]